MSRRPTAGIRFFICEDCGTEWQNNSRDCLSPSGEFCISENNNCENYEFGVLLSPYKSESHPEWPTDDSGNLISGYDYSTESLTLIN